MEWPIGFDGGRATSAGMDTSLSTGTILTGGAINTKGSYVELLASTPWDAAGFLVFFATGVSGRGYLVDIAVGAATEQVLVSNLYVDSGAAGTMISGPVYFPVPIAAGTRLAARCQASAAAATVKVGLVLLAGGFFGLPTIGRVVTVGATTATSRGITIPGNGTTANVLGTVVELTASVAHDLRGLALAFGSGINSAPSSCTWLFNLLVGAATERVLLPNLLLTTAASSALRPAFLGAIPCSIAAGTRIAAQVQCSIIGAVDKDIDVVLYGIG
jgi:hypothetical protein